MTTDELLDTVRSYALDHFPRASTIQVVITIPRCDSVTLCVPVYSAPAGRETVLETSPGRQPAADALTPTERRILRAAIDAEVEAPTADEVASHIHPRVPNDQYLRRMLSGLRKRGYLGGEYREAGYPVTPKAMAQFPLPQAD
jgi:hypothetical protein